MDIAVRNCMWVRIKENHCRRDVVTSDSVMVFAYTMSKVQICGIYLSSPCIQSDFRK